MSQLGDIYREGIEEGPINCDSPLVFKHPKLAAQVCIRRVLEPRIEMVARRRPAGRPGKPRPVPVLVV